MLTTTFQFVERKVSGTLDYGEAWGGATGKDQVALEWLAWEGATSEQNSNVSIEKYIQRLAELMVLSHSGARKRYTLHRQRGWIKTKRYSHSSKVWLAFKPPIEIGNDNPESAQSVPLSLYPSFFFFSKILNKISW